MGTSWPMRETVPGFKVVIAGEWRSLAVMCVLVSETAVGKWGRIHERVCFGPKSAVSHDTGTAPPRSYKHTYSHCTACTGAGIAGLTLALGLLRQGVRVEVLERDLTAVRGEGKVRGPIQVRRAVRV